MKLYDYARRINKSLKDKQWDWADEEFRRIWDVLYNKREQYPNQVTGSSNNDPSSFYINNKNFAYLSGIGQTRSTGEGGLFIATGALLSEDRAAVGISTGDNSTAAPAKDVDEAFTYGVIGTTTTVDSVASIQLCLGPVDNGLCYPIQLPRAIFIIRTLDSISDRIIHIGLAGSALASTASVPAGSEHLPSTVTAAFFNAFTLFYKPVALGGSQTSANWQVCHRYQTQTASFADTGVVVETNKIYQMEIVFTRELRIVNLLPELSYRYYVYINGNQVFTDIITSPSGSNYPDVATNITSLGRKYTPIVWMRNKTAATARYSGVQKIFIDFANPLVNYDKTTWNKLFGLT